MSTPQQVAGRYVLSRRLGAGGMSTVFLATDDVLERPVAVKLLAEHLAEDEDFVARFRREALAAARLQHPNIVQVFDSGQDPETDRHYIVMEYVDGPSTAELLREHRQLDVDETVRIVRDACHGLEYAHRAGVVHRDVKPGNLLLTADGILKLADFGIAKAAEQTRITQVGSVLGTAAYLSPEQAAGEEAGPPSDLYSLGVCAYQFLTGRLPHEYGSLTELALKQQNEPVQPITDLRGDIPPSLDRAIRASLERDPNARYANALEMADALEAGYRGEDTDTTRGIFSTGTEYATGAGLDTDATQALPRGNTMYQPPPSRRLAPATGTMAPARYDEYPAERPRRERNWGKIIAGLLALALVAVAIYLAVGLGSDADQIREGDVDSQAESLKTFIEDNSE
jgi:eukaryotic-like serine/threonine-protein kinase